MSIIFVLLATNGRSDPCSVIENNTTQNAIWKTSCSIVTPPTIAIIANTIDALKQHGVWVFGADMDGDDYTRTDFDTPCALVIGNEGKGIGALTAKKCDAVISLPMCGKINSLNASVAAGILMYEVVRSRNADKKPRK